MVCGNDDDDDTRGAKAVCTGRSARCGRCFGTPAFNDASRVDSNRVEEFVASMAVPNRERSNDEELTSIFLANKITALS